MELVPIIVIDTLEAILYDVSAGVKTDIEKSVNRQKCACLTDSSSVYMYLSFSLIII
jgi:hypothetical protein